MLEHRRTAGPAFINRLHNLLTDRTVQDKVTWSQNGDIVILHTASFAAEVIPRFFKHNNLSSFVRQLNLYGFKKTAHRLDSCEFWHPTFRPGNEHQFKYIQRKVSPDSSAGQQDLSKTAPVADAADMRVQIEELASQQRALQAALQQQDTDALRLRALVTRTNQRNEELEARFASIVEVFKEVVPCMVKRLRAHDGGSMPGLGVGATTDERTWDWAPGVPTWHRAAIPTHPCPAPLDEMTVTGCSDEIAIEPPLDVAQECDIAKAFDSQTLQLGSLQCAAGALASAEEPLVCVVGHQPLPEQVPSPALAPAEFSRHDSDWSRCPTPEDCAQIGQASVLGLPLRKRKAPSSPYL